jgi:1-deoxy-D-xylulose-5-phosphate synthase
MNTNTERLLGSDNLLAQLKDFSTSELEQLAKEVREKLLEVGDTCGGHLASNLGVVELTIVLHALFDSPKDKFLWDTSHQTYVHKMLTGRLDKMHTIRQDGGLSGFAKITESEHDTFGAGHASTALSAALGIAHARDLAKEDYAVIPVVGDASFSGGMTFEALNNIDRLNSNLICILNDNDMSISRPVGSMANYINTIRTSPIFEGAKSTFNQLLKKVPKIGESLQRRVDKAVDHMRDVILDTNVGVMFEEFGFKYLGPIDGHDIPTLMAALNYAKKYEGPIMVHIMTQKGKGHQPAEQDPIKYHGVSPKPTSPAPTAPKAKTFTSYFGDSCIDICNRKEDVVVITPAMEGGSGLTPFKEAHPERFFDVGIAEEHAVTFSAGLARAGAKPILAIYSTFLQRGYDQIIHDVCLQKLPVVFGLDRAGIVGADGPTHHGVFDFVYMLPIPHLTILAPKDGRELQDMMDWAIEQKEAVSLRYPRGGVSERNGDIFTPMSQQLLEVLHDPEPQQNLDVLILGVGSMAWPGYEASKALQTQGISSAAINLRCVKPLDTDFLRPFIDRAKHIIVVEEGQAIGGVYDFVVKSFRDLDRPLSDWHQIAIPDEFVDHGDMNKLRDDYDLSSAGIVRRVTSIVETKINA